jgi:DNA-binding protein H-NS
MAKNIYGIIAIQIQSNASLINQTDPTDTGLQAQDEGQPKYRNPKNRSETWAGRGRMPLWLAAEIKKGRKLEAFGI